MLHYHPELTDLRDAGDGTGRGFKPATLQRGVAWVPRNWQRVSTDTGIGSPAAATAAKGARFAADVTADYAELLRDLCGELYED